MLVCCVSCVCLNVVTEGGAIMDKLRGHLDRKSSLKEAESSSFLNLAPKPSSPLHQHWSLIQTSSSKLRSLKTWK